MGYVSSLREVVGHRPLILAGAAVLLLNETNELLMIRRSDTGDWGVPGGMMEPGETPEQTAQRELLEETNLEASEIELFGVFSGPALYYCYPNGDEVYNVSIVYVARYVHGEVRLLDGEHSDFRYFALSEIPEHISPPIRPVLMDLLERFNLPAFGRSNEDQTS